MKNSCLVLLRTLGDVILSNTLAKNIKDQFPEDRLTLIIEKQYIDFVEMNPCIDSFYVPKDWNDVLNNISNFDKIYLAQQTNHTDTIWHQTEKYGNMHLLDYYAFRCRIELKDRRLMLWYPEKEIKLAKGNDFIGKKIVCIQTTSGVPTKDWQYYNELAIKLNQEGYYVWQIGFHKDKVIENAEHLNCLSLSKGTSEDNYFICNVLKNADLYIGGDTGWSYIAGAIGTKCLILQGSTSKITSAPFGENITHIESEKRCVPIPCHTNCRTGSPCINAISIDTVFEKAKELIR